MIGGDDREIGTVYCDKCYRHSSFVPDPYSGSPCIVMDEHKDGWTTVRCLLCGAEHEAMVRMKEGRMEVQEAYVITADPPPTLTPVRKVYIRQADEESMAVYFNADADVARIMRGYGEVKVSPDYPFAWRLYVDGRYDFGEVVAVLESIE